MNQLIIAIIYADYALILFLLIVIHHKITLILNSQVYLK